MATLTVGIGQQYSTIAAAVAAAGSGDTIEVQAGTYVDDFLTIRKSLTLQAIGGPVRMVETQSPPNGKAMIVEGASGINVTIDGFDISGVQVPDGNGAAVRYEGGALTLENVYFHNNQDGMLAAADPTGTITINNSEFAYNGTGDGRTHNLYVNEVQSLYITNSYFHDANVGHEIKSRADNTTITGSRIFDNTSTASYSIDLPNGGNATIQNNIIEQGPNSENPNIIAYGEEGSLHSGTDVLISNNIIVNDDTSSSSRAVWNATTVPLVFDDNSIYGLTSAKLTTGPIDQSGNTFLTDRPTLDTSSSWSSGLCFCAGTAITTPGGEVPVEHLSAGDHVLTHSGKRRRIVWIGVGQVLVQSGRRCVATPVIVRRHALADNVPNRDLRLTRGHALYLRNVLVPVEELINQRSILWDERAQGVEVYHIELATHDVLMANGAPVESYRDDGNRWLFQNANQGRRPPPRSPCAPLLTNGPIVDELWRQLLERAGPCTGVHLTGDADLHLLVDGRRVDALGRLEDGTHVFRLVTRPREVRLCSRAAVPQDLGIARDPRMLGVAVRRIVFAQPWRQRVICPDAQSLTDGYHEFEATNGLRWTDGDATVPSWLFANMDGPAMLMVQPGATTWYPDQRAVDQAA